MMRKTAQLFPLLLFIFLSLTVQFPVLAAEAIFSLSPASGSYNVNETFDINVVLNAGGGKIGGADIYLTFDQNKLNLVDIENGTIFNQYVGKNINNTTGTAAISGLADNKDTAFTGNDTFVKLRFKALSQGSTEVKFNFTLGDTKDSNAIDFDTLGDVLTSVVNGSYTITGVGGSTDGNGTTIAPTKQIPVTANQTPTILVLIFGISLLLSGVVIRKSFKSF